MVRSPNLQPNQVAFRVPPSCNKFDIHSYLTNIYGVNVQEVRTMNYATVHKKARNGRMEVSQPAYKKAIVTIDEAFTWPAEPEWCALEREQFKLGSKGAGRKMKGWRFRAPEEERTRMKEISEELHARMEAEQGRKK
ncbi:ribosomal protein L23-domain-containing protein [Fennellomyces sp. T-0311]|nr:ribosomal protein L23-domain-containing protein [Fennellomyces sp. T-0311]